VAEEHVVSLEMLVELQGDLGEHLMLRNESVNRLVSALKRKGMSGWQTVASCRCGLKGRDDCVSQLVVFRSSSFTVALPFFSPLYPQASFEEHHAETLGLAERMLCR